MMLATETRVQVSILGYLSSDLKEAVGGRQDSGVGIQESGFRRLFLFIVPTPHTPHPTPHTPHPTPHTPHPTSPHPTPHTPHPTPQN
ncbi:MAG: hypothetical protein O9295_15795 [Microcystis sp. LE18-22.4A]|nr:hypothetical protein [Microcystis sp. LE18-22.4A]